MEAQFAMILHKILMLKKKECEIFGFEIWAKTNDATINFSPSLFATHCGYRFLMQAKDVAIDV